MHILIAKNPCNLDTHQTIKILLISYSAYVISKDQNKFVFYVNNYIYQNQFNQLYNLNQIDKDIKNTDTIAYKLKQASTRVTNYRLKIANKKKQKRQEIVKKRKTEVITTKCQRVKKEISLFSKKRKNYIADKMDLNQANDKYPVQF